MLLEPRQQVERLVAKYQNLTQKQRRDYNEANTKNVFVQPLFEALGWDFSDINQVEAEKTIAKGRVDYVLKVNKVSKFCLEVKPLRDELTDDYRKQAISYAYNKGVTWAVLTNFDRLQVFNAERQTPDLNSILSLNLSYQDYVTHLDDLRLLSRELVIDNALDKVAERYGRLALRIPVEKRLYQHLRDSRGKLSNEIYKFHKDMAITLETTDRLIQELFNRLLFIRTAEDRDLAGNHPLLASLHQWRQDRSEELIEHLRRIFRQFAQLYDSDLFPSVMDPWEQIWVSSDLLAETIEGLYDVPSDFARYDFAAIDADVLGQVYEQYLGYIAQVAKEEAKKQQMRLFPPAERIEITAKIEKRKAGGIYYTPKWVTDYIVKQTVGRFIEEHNHNEILNIKILDPACGSGSFLIRAYDELLNYHAKVKGKTVADLDWMERMEVLTRNIFGVDLDPQAVEIARLNLLIRALAEIKSLPPLASNIQCGNSLISGSDEELQECLGDNFKDKKPFNWEDTYPNIMKQGGFDIVIGNPPYVNEARGNKELFRELKALPKLGAYYEKNMDLFNYFVEVGLDLLKEGGFLAYIIPAYWQDRTGATLLRNKVVKDTNIEHLVDLGEFKVFEGAPGQHNNIVVLRKVSPHDKTYSLKYVQVAKGSIQGRDIPLLTEPKQLDYALVNKKLIIGQAMLSLVKKISKENTFYLSKDEVMRGVDTSPSTHEGKGVFVLSESEYLSLRKEITREQEVEFFKPFYKASQIDKYYYEPKNHYWLLYTDARRKQLLEDKRDECRAIVNHLDSFSDVISSDNKPYGLHRPKTESNFLDESKILFLRKTPYPKFVSIPIPYFVDESVYLITWHRPLCDLKYLLTIFNSTLAKWWFGRQKKHGAQLQIDKEQIISFPIKRIDFGNSLEKKSYDELVALAGKMLELTQKLEQSKTEGEDIFGDKRKELESEIHQATSKIDQLVYQLYGITDEEREIIGASL